MVFEVSSNPRHFMILWFYDLHSQGSLSVVPYVPSLHPSIETLKVLSQAGYFHY